MVVVTGEAGADTVWGMASRTTNGGRGSSRGKAATQRSGTAAKRGSSNSASKSSASQSTGSKGAGSKGTGSKAGASKGQSKPRPGSTHAPRKAPAKRSPAKSTRNRGGGLGGVVRAVGRTRELDPAHRRDGVALIYLALAVVVAAGVWWQAGGPVGHWFDWALRSVIGIGAIVLPIVLLITSVILMRTETSPEARPRVVIGSVLLLFATLGTIHVLSGSPLES